MDTRVRLERHRAIKNLIQERQIPDQSTLVQALQEMGFEVTQSSVSRDLREVHVSKVDGAYRLLEPTAEQGDRELSRVLSQSLRSSSAAGPNLLVLHTEIGFASRLAVLLDQQNWLEIVGSIAGDDTIFLATAGAREQRILRDRLEQLKDQSS